MDDGPCVQDKPETYNFNLLMCPAQTHGP